MIRTFLVLLFFVLTFGVSNVSIGATDCVLADPSITAPAALPPQEPADKKIRGAKVAIYVDLDNCKVLGLDSLDPNKAYKVNWVKPDPSHSCDYAAGCYIIKVQGVPYCRCP